MAEGSKVRLVRCPKCDNLLPELPNFSVYQCGGCGALLRAKKKVSLEKERDKQDFEKLETLSEAERESSDGGFPDKRKEGVFGERTVNLISGSRTQNKDISIDNINRIAKDEIVGYQNGAQKGIGYNDRHRLPLKHPIGNWVSDGDNETNMSRSEPVNSSKAKDIAEVSAHFKGSARPLRSKAWGLDGDGLERPYGNFKTAIDPNPYSHFAYPDEGPSNYYSRSPTNGYGNSYTDLEQYRAELLWKLDELNEQIRRSDSVSEKKREGSLVGVKLAPPGYKVPVKTLVPDHEHAPISPHFDQFQNNSHDIDSHDVYFPPKHLMNDFPVYNGPTQLQMLRVNSHQPLGQYRAQPQFASYPRGMLYQESTSCDCFHCYHKNQQISSQNQNFMEDPINSNFNRHVNPITFGSKNLNPPPLCSQDPQSHAIWPSDISDMDVLYQSAPRTTVVASRRNRRLCHPVAGGAPFVTCCSCFELLKLPRKLKIRENNQQKLQCGACSIVYLLEIRNKQLLISVLEQNNQKMGDANDGSREVSKKVFSSPDGGVSTEGMNFSVDFDSPGYDFHSTDFERNIQSDVKEPNSSEYKKRQGLSSLSSVSSNEEESLDSMTIQRDFSYFPELHKKDNTSPTFSGSPLVEHLYDASSDHGVNRYEEGNKINRTEPEKFFLDNSTSPQNLVKYASSETEVEVSFNEYLNTSLSQDSMEVSKEERRSRVNKGTEPYLVGLLKKSFRDFSRPDQHMEEEEANVFVNGQPIPDSMVKSAEKLAGPIHPGDYWYDVQAGFWGLMGQPCLGIIPPFIKEFNYPMKENCGAGNTGVFVNGRELNQKDLDLLAGRGLPTTKDKFYKIEISGRVIDKESGKELKSLGKLAPTIQKLNRGFGMKVPKKRV
ncbi:hypothetical protein JCGZ_20481 [Jatropha curcas]|uniref:Uncharacterized protein n=1 Tax=Jatropha curcas TaxID=180498 RepID=A0A067JZ99_JATCU|nr:protein ENHANCED DISEASE RESISTANCE 4 [Jatropha curcas]XP_020539703.1 protein ENHANCED DISEASE RESISTANCE 4 [Jatropha curcas]KDP25325.1 hypothetical protein JCGZ_20481 [Jatropha curcas]